MDKSVSGTLARIVDSEPPLPSTIRSQSLPDLDPIVARCLRKKSLDRYESTHDLVADFEELELAVAQLRQRGSSRSGHLLAASPRPSHDEQWWWQVHQLTVSVIYTLLVYPAWYVQPWLPRPWGFVFLLAVLAPAAAGTSLRLHLRFIARHDPGELPSQLPRSRLWTRVCDALFALSLLMGALAIGTEHPEFAMIFVAAAVAMLVAALVIEPATAKAAFGSEPPK